MKINPTNHKLILFDADGVVITSDSFIYQYEGDFGVDHQEFLHFFENEFQGCLIGNADLKQAIVPYLLQWKWTKSVDEFLDYWFQSENKVDAELITQIQELRGNGIRCVLATNQETYRTDFIRKDMSFSNYFDQIYSSCEIGYRKPQTEYYQYILEQESVNAEDCIFYDDSQVNIDAARSLGIESVLIK